MSPASLAYILSPSKFLTPPHILYINRKLVEVGTGRIRRLMVNLAPRHGKSRLISEIFPVWYLMHNPDHRVVFVSYSINLARRFGRICRDFFREVGPILDLDIDPDVFGSAEWQIKGHTGGMVSVGVGGSLTGRGADCIIIDDPVKGHEEAMSETTRDSIEDFYQATLYSRLEPGGRIVLIQTRWHFDDLSGRLLQAMHDEDGDQWEHINLPAIAVEDEDWEGFHQRKKGEALWPERYPIEKLQEIRTVQNAFWFSALYQQDPMPESGTLFKREWFDIIEYPPEDLKPAVRYWDLAASDARDADYTTGTLYGWSKARKQWVVADVVRMRETPGNVERIIRQTAMRDGKRIPIWIEQEPGSSGKSLIYHYQTNVLNGFTCRGHRPTGNKEVRAVPVSALAESGLIALVSARWNREWLDEVEVFPLGGHDDQVDSMSGAHDVITNSMTHYKEGARPFGIGQESKWKVGL